MMLKLVFVVSCLLLLHCSEAQTPINRDCSVSEEQDRLQMDDFSQDCRDAYLVLNLTSAESFLTIGLSPSVYDMLCSDACFSPFMEVLEMCYATDGLMDTFMASCLFNADGTMCYTATYNSISQSDDPWQVTVRAECFVNFDFAVNPLAGVTTELAPTCSDGCRAGLRQFNDELGCCVNSIYNNTFVAEHLPFAGYELWSGCGLESERPDFCSSAVIASALSTGIYVLAIVLGAMFL